VPYLRAANVSDGRLNLDDVKEMNFSPGEQSVFALRPGDVLVTEGSGSLGTVGASATWQGEIRGTVCFQNTLLRLRPKDGQTDPRFLAWWSRATFADGVYASIASGANIFHLSAERVRALPLHRPPLDEQRRIADFLDAGTARITHLTNTQESAIKVVSERRKRVLEDIVIGREGRESRIPLGYLTEYDRPIMYGIVLPGPNVEDGVPIVKGGDVAAGRLSLAQLNKTTHEIEASYKKSRLRAGDLVIAIRGSVGEVASVPAEIAGANLTQDAARIAPGSAVDARWLELALQTPTIQEQIGSRITGATVKGINIWDLRRVLVPNISLDEQSEAVNQAEAALTRIDDFRSAARQQVSLLAERRQALITAAVTGGISV
jgi:type I restriction enzyme S subunit